MRRQVLDPAQIEARRVAADFGDPCSGRAGANKGFAQIVKPGLRRDHQGEPGPISKLAKDLKAPRTGGQSKMVPRADDRYVVENDIAIVSDSQSTLGLFAPAQMSTTRSPRWYTHTAAPPVPACRSCFSS